MVSVQPRFLTVDEFDRLPGPDAGKLELDEGRVVQHMPVNWQHGELQVAISSALRAFAAPRGLGTVLVETGFFLGTNAETGRDTVRAPDVSFVPTERIPPPEQQLAGVARLVPDLAVEVLSPGDRAPDVLRKVRQYLDAGVRRVWLVEPEERTVSVIDPAFGITDHGAGTTLSSEDAGLAEPGFALPVDSIFPPAGG